MRFNPLFLFLKNVVQMCNGSVFVSRTEQAGMPDWLVGCRFGKVEIQFCLVFTYINSKFIKARRYND